MNAFISTFVAFLLAVISQFNSSLEKSFLQNDPYLFKELVPINSPLLLTLPEPLNISDCFSPDQTFLMMKKIFHQTLTQEFFVDQENQTVFGPGGAIVQARWSFLNRLDSRKYVFRLYFYLYPEKTPLQSQKSALKIREIRAERI